MYPSKGETGMEKNILGDGITFKGTWTIERIDKQTGKTLDSEIKENIIVNTGKERVAKLLNGVSAAYFDYIGVGKGVADPAVGDTTLGDEYTRAQAAVSYEASYKAKYEKIFDFAEAVAITEAGIFDQLTVGGSTMFNRLTFSAKNVDADTSLKISITITVA